MKRSTRGLLMAGLVFFITGAALGIASLSAGFRYGDFAEAVEQGKFRLVGPEKWIVGVRTALSDAADQGNWLERIYTGVESLDLKVGQAGVQPAGETDGKADTISPDEHHEEGGWSLDEHYDHLDQE